MAQIRPRDLLTDGLLARLGGTSPYASALAGQVLAGSAQAARLRAAPAAGPGHIGTGPDIAAVLRRDIARLADVDYLKVALPPEFGGLGCTLRQAACGQRRLARHAPLTALAVSAHLYWTGAAADAYRAGDDSVRWILLEAARGALFAAGHGGIAAGGDLRLADPQSRCEPAGESGYRFRNPAVLSSLTPTWDWVAVHAIHPATGAAHPRPDAVLAFAGRGSRCTPAFRVARVAPAGRAGRHLRLVRDRLGARDPGQRPVLGRPPRVQRRDGVGRRRAGGLAGRRAGAGGRTRSTSGRWPRPGCASTT